MTAIETRFYLREIHSHWSPPHISGDKMRELVENNLIETSTEEGELSVRLTREGQRIKMASRPQNNREEMPPRQQQARRRKFRSKPMATRPKALV